MKINCYFRFLFFGLMIFIESGCVGRIKITGQTTRRLFLGDHEEIIQGIYINNAFVSTQLLSPQQISFLYGSPIADSGEIVVVHPFEGLTWVDAMIYCEMIRTNLLNQKLMQHDEIVRLPTIHEIEALTRHQPQSTMYANKITNIISTPSIEQYAVYEWTCQLKALDYFICYQHLDSTKNSLNTKPFKALEAYPNLKMRLVIAPKNELFEANKKILTALETEIWNLRKKQHYYMHPFR